jgi:hypothetical protein
MPEPRPPPARPPASCQISGHGNFGSLDDDPPAAMRYTECRLAATTPPLLLEDLEADTVGAAAALAAPAADGRQPEPSVRARQPGGGRGLVSPPRGGVGASARAGLKGARRACAFPGEGGASTTRCPRAPRAPRPSPPHPLPNARPG